MYFVNLSVAAGEITAVVRDALTVRDKMMRGEEVRSVADVLQVSLTFNGRTVMLHDTDTADDLIRRYWAADPRWVEDDREDE